jgi:catechol 2,3-dioxygenase-like lactoylglutathione lyase family enzyme
MLQNPKLIEGHYECRRFDETLPVFTDLLGMEVVQRRSDSEVVMKHPNSGWSMVLHAAGPDAKDKPLMNHYGWRVNSREEVDRAHEYLKKVKEEYHLPRVGRPSLLHIAYSFYFGEPGGNSLELEYYEPDAAKASAVYGPHWDRPYAGEIFAGKGYVCQGLSHGTLECDQGDKELYRRFIAERLGLELVPLPPELPVLYLKDSFNPWYVVVVPQRIRRYLNQNSRFTLEVESSEAVREAYQEFATAGNDARISYLGELGEESGRAYFFLSDPAKNWWEVTAPRDVAYRS